MAIKEESDFLNAKSALENRKQETKILNLNYEIDPNGKPDPEKSKRRLQRTVNKLLNAFLDAWPVLRLRYIASYEDYQYLESMPEELKRLEFYIFMQSETQGMMIADFFRECYTDEWELKPDCKYIEVIKKARKDRFGKLQLFAEDAPEQALQSFISRIDTLDIPVDKINSDYLFSRAGNIPMGQLMLDTAEDPETGEIYHIYYAINFDECEKLGIKITKRLDGYDKLVLETAGALYNANIEAAGGKKCLITASQICKNMGLSTNQTNMKNVNDSLDKMRLAIVYIENKEEAEGNTNYPPFKYDGPVLPFERVTGKFNELETDNAIHMFREPPPLTFAKSRNQFTTVPRQLLDVPKLNKTRRNITIINYLIDEIGRIKHGRRNPKILYATLFSHLNIPAAQRKRDEAKAKEATIKILEHFKAEKWIYDYSKEANGIKIFTSKAIAEKAEK